MTDAQRYLQGHVVEGRFPLIQYLGGTGHSSVFLTECANREQKRAAIKLIPAPHGNAQPLLTRWRLAARFSHPHLLRLYEAGRCTLDDAEMLYVVMEYAEGDLAQTLSERPLSPSEAGDLLHPLLEVLSYIHGKGFVHGHVQPSNIMAIGDRLKLSSDRICHIGEFGDVRNGNAPYCAPECGGSECLSPASDIWSLGMTIVECLTERLPEARGSRGAVSVPSNLPSPFSEMARHCLRRSPHRRWDIAALQSRLKLSAFALQEAHADRLATPAAPAPRPAVAVRRDPPALEAEPTAESAAKLRRSLALGAAALSVAAVAMGVVFLRPASHPAPEPSHLVKIDAAAVKAPPPASAPPQPAANISPQPDLPPSRLSATIASSEPGRVVEAASLAPTSLHSTAESEGGVLHRVLPDVPRFASDTISGTLRVDVRVKVNSLGKVTAAELESAGHSRYFARLSLDAARDWKFRAPDVNSKSPSREWLIRFDYTRRAATAVAEPRTR